MFEKLKNMIKERPESCVTIFAPIEGESVPVTEVSDPAFGEETVGRGVAIKPAKGRVVAPADGEVSMMFRTGHAVAMTLSGGVEVLIHVGLDTVNLGGNYFTPRVHNGDKVKKGDMLIEFNIESIAGDGYDLISPVIVTNHDDFKGMDTVTGKSVSEGDALIKVSI